MAGPSVHGLKGQDEAQVIISYHQEWKTKEANLRLSVGVASRGRPRVCEDAASC